MGSLEVREDAADDGRVGACLDAQEKLVEVESLRLAAHAELEEAGGPAARAAAERLVEDCERWAVADPGADLASRIAAWRARSLEPDTR